MRSGHVATTTALRGSGAVPGSRHSCGRTGACPAPPGYTVQEWVVERECVALARALGPDGRQVALKLACGPGPTVHTELLRHEHQVLQVLDGCPHTPPVHAFGTHDSRGSCGVFLATGWVPGIALADLYRQAGGLLDQDTALGADLFAETATAVAEAFVSIHRHGVAHGDVSPRNILLTATGDAALIDFESARTPTAAPAGPARRTRTFCPPRPRTAGEGRGTGAGFSGAAAFDQYGVAATLLWLLTGQAPQDHSATGGPDLSWAAARWPRLPAVFTTALAPGAGERFPSTEAFAHALADALHQSPGPAPTGPTTPS